jgi:sigma-B regulation protein RsbU (phosphoserine phosphatase)
MEKTTKLRILHVEDDALDAELVSHALRMAGLDCTIHVAVSRRGCLEALERGTFDLVVSDSHGHDFTGPDILRLVRERLPDAPFIFLSGSFDDTDPEALKTQGAADCLLKDDLDSLAPAIRRAMQSRL